MASTGAKIEAALPYALPVLGGTLGVTFVQLNSFSYLNPVIAIATGAILGRVAAVFIVRAMRRSRRKGR
ncbi:hypothetical protein [Shimia sp.]|uniref:hypothetical protein n=1 Tax=Shimia sp. TaxID=1954381 RepID=UPI00356A6252